MSKQQADVSMHNQNDVIAYFESNSLYLFTLFNSGKVQRDMLYVILDGSTG